MTVNWRNVAYQSAVNAGHPDPEMFVRQMMAESGLRPGQTSSAGATGIAQIIPSTAKAWGVDPNDPVASLNAAARAMTKYMASYHGNAPMALAAYNAGTGAVQKYNGVPPYAETRAYIAKIMNGHSPAGRPPASPQGAVQAPQQGQGDPVALSNQVNRIQNAYADSPDLAAPHVDKLMAGFKGGLSNPVHAAPGAPGIAGSLAGGNDIRSKLVATARGEVGTLKDQAMKYIRANGGTGYEPWCGDFVNYVLQQHGLSAPARSVPGLNTWARQNGTYANTGRAGDLVMFDWDGDHNPDHVEMVVGGRGPGRYQTIGGNTSGPGGSSMVADKLRSENIMGFVNVAGRSATNKPRVTPPPALTPTNVRRRPVRSIRAPNA